MSTEKTYTIAVAGNPNSGKTTLFNGLTGSRQRVGNWPGVTVEKKTGSFIFDNQKIDVVDLPGIYSLTSHSEDERVARDYLLAHAADAVVNIVDASNLERNLFLTINLAEMRVPLIVVLNMVDLAEKKGLSIDPSALSKSLGVPVLPLSAIKSADIAALKQQLTELLLKAAPATAKVQYPETIEKQLAAWEPRLKDIARNLGSEARWLALKLLEEDEHLGGKVAQLGALDAVSIKTAVNAIERAEHDSPDGLIAGARYDLIAEFIKVCRSASAALAGKSAKPSTGEKVDRVVLNRFLGIPIFIGVMYLLFWFVINVGGSFIDFFDISFGAVFVDGFGRLLESLGSPAWLVALLAGGIGGGIQTVATFVPIMFVMFFMLSLLEDSGYMARAAFVMDRALRAIGLPGKAFIPMIVGFGCTVPAVMATRTLENKRDRYLTVFMTPFMSCGARLPVYALFGAAFFPNNAGLIVLSLYLVGILLAVATGFLLKSTMFRGEPAPFVMELPPYHRPRLLDLLKHSWVRLKMFVLRAGKVIIIAVMVLGVLNSIGTDGSFGNEDSQESVLSAVGKAITPVFTPMGIEKENWPATVGIFTGLFAKEAVVGTLNGLYSQMDATDSADDSADDLADSAAVNEDEEADEWSLGGELAAAVVSIGDAFAGLAGSLLDPFGFSLISSAGDEEAIAEEVEADMATFGAMRKYFSGGATAAYAYLLFILIYFPCLAALGAIIREIGPLFGWVSVTYLTVLAWITATLFYQIAMGHQLVWIVVPLVLLALIIVAFAAMRKRALPGRA